MSASALDHVSIEGFKSIASIERLELRQINIVIGPNGSGKSNFIGIFSFLKAIREGRLAEYVGQAGGAEKILHFGSKTTQAIRVHLSFAEEIDQYEIRMVPTRNDEFFVSDEAAYFWNKAYPSPYREELAGGREAGISRPVSHRSASYVQQRMASWRVYHLHDTSSSSPMRKTAKVDDNASLRQDGSNLAAFLYLLQQTHAASYELIRGAVQRVAPFFDDFQLRPRLLQPNDIRLEWRHKNSEQYFDASALSDGTLRFIALATLLLQPEELRPSLILVDEPELGLHPHAIGLLAALIRQASTQTQVVVSTQSSLLLDQFDPADVLVANRVGGSTHFTRLDGTALAEWLQDYSLGQLWEKNEIGGRPSPE